MSLLKAKQFDLVDLSAALVQYINENSGSKTQWAEILNTTYFTAVFSAANSNITPGQSNFVVSYATVPLQLFVYRNGIKLLSDVDFTLATGAGTFTITLADPVGASSGGSFSETIEINYY